jgi:flagellar basal body-associated protein FliL
MADEAPDAQEQKPKPKVSLKMMLVIGAVFVLEAGIICAVFMMKDPAPSEATSAIEGTQEQPRDDLAEIQIAEPFQVENYTRGNARTMITLEVWATYIKPDPEEEVDQDAPTIEELITTHRSSICDRIRMRVASANQNELKDPKLEVVKRIIKSDIGEIIGEGMVENILLPKWSPVDLN